MSKILCHAFLAKLIQERVICSRLPLADMAYSPTYLALLKNPDLRVFASARLISGFTDALIPIAFAIETLRVEPSGWGMAMVLIALWLGKFLGMLGYQYFGAGWNPIGAMVYCAFIMGFSQFACFYGCGCLKIRCWL